MHKQSGHGGHCCFVCLYLSVPPTANFGCFGVGWSIFVIFSISRDLMEAYPEAKVVLTVRDPERWYTSVEGTIYQMCQSIMCFPGNIFGRVTGGLERTLMIQKLVRKDQNRFKQGKCRTSRLISFLSLLFFSRACRLKRHSQKTQ